MNPKPKVRKVNLGKLFWKIPFYKMPFRFKKFIAKLLLHSFRGLGPTYYNDLVLMTKINAMNDELNLWIKTDGRPTTSNVNYQLNTMKFNKPNEQH
jgi:hypothetical protein